MHTIFDGASPPLCALAYMCVTEFELHQHLVSAMRPVSSYFVDVHFFRASTCNGFYLLFVHSGRHSKFPVVKKVSIEAGPYESPILQQIPTDTEQTVLCDK
jgi:hypothetical protein